MVATNGGIAVAVGPAVGTSQLAVGVTHGEYSADAGGDPGAVAQARGLLRNAAVYQNQHIMGWGALNPEPSPGTYDWESLDTRVTLIRQTGGGGVLTLCCAPDWMKGGAPGRTDWSQLETAPTPDHYADFAALARQVALRYPDVLHYQVWNEMKGFYDAARNRWDYEGYTRLYNLVYDALKATNPAIQVGGPYVVMDSWGDAGAGGWPVEQGPLAGEKAYGWLDQRPLDVITYWLANKHGADFMCVDGGDENRDGVVHNDDPFVGVQKFADVTAWIRHQTALPIWWSEWHTSASGDPERRNAVEAVALMELAKGGAAVTLAWQPQAAARRVDPPESENIWSDTGTSKGGKPFPFYFTQQAFKEYFGTGTELDEVVVSDASKVAALASPWYIMIVNKTGVRQQVRVGGEMVTLSRYKVITRFRP